MDKIKLLIASRLLKIAADEFENPKPIQKNRFNFLDGITPKRRAFNQKFHNFKGR